MDESKLNDLLDRAAIGDVQLRYATGIDMRDWPLYRTCFTDDLEIDFSSVFGGGSRQVKADRWVETVRRTISGLKATQHMITNHVITLAGDEATCVAYVQARHHLPNDTGASDQAMFGYYTNRFVRTSLGWRIRACKLTVTWNTGNWHVFELARRLLDEREGRAPRQRS
jgi:hypothetical protein